MGKLNSSYFKLDNYQDYICSCEVKNSPTLKAKHKKQAASFQRQMKFLDNPPKPKEPEEFSLDTLVFSIGMTAKELELPQLSLSINISNLVTLGLLKWETDVEVSAEKSSEDPEDTDIDVSVDVYNNDDFIFTHFGDKFVKICKSK